MQEKNSSRILDVIIECKGAVYANYEHTIEPYVDDDQTRFFEVPQNTKIFDYSKPKYIPQPEIEEAEDTMEGDDQQEKKSSDTKKLSSSKNKR